MLTWLTHVIFGPPWSAFMSHASPALCDIHNLAGCTFMLHALQATRFHGDPCHFYEMTHSKRMFLMYCADEDNNTNTNWHELVLKGLGS